MLKVQNEISTNVSLLFPILSVLSLDNHFSITLQSALVFNCTMFPIIPIIIVSILIVFVRKHNFLIK